MSQVLELRIPDKKISKKKIEAILIELGYKKTAPREYFFYEQKDFLSFGAIRLEFMDYKNGIKIHTSSGALRNKFDIDKQNETIRTLKKSFGGYVHNDWSSGTYIQGWEDSSYNSVERACGLAYHKFKFNYIRVLTMSRDAGIENEDKDLPSFILQTTPSGNFGNLIIPFLVSITEDFLKTFFIRYLQYSENIKIDYGEKIEKYFNVGELTKIANKEKVISEIIAGRYSFQNIGDINTAYKRYFKVDVKGGIWKNEIDTFEEIIEKRHKIIHEAEFYMISKEELQKYTKCINSICKSLISFIEERDNIRLDLDRP